MQNRALLDPQKRAEGVGFEPTRHFCPPVFKTGSIGRSDSPPYDSMTVPNSGVRIPPEPNRRGSEGREQHGNAVVEIGRGDLVSGRENLVGSLAHRNSPSAF
jgi:hypothetical protein